MDSRAEAIQKVRDGDVLGAHRSSRRTSPSNLQSTLEPGKVEVFYNAEDPAKQEFVENTIEAQVQRANAALTKRIAEEALDLLNLISRRRRRTASSGRTSTCWDWRARSAS